MLRVSELKPTPESLERFRDVGARLNASNPLWSHPADPPAGDDVALFIVGTEAKPSGRVALLHNPDISLDGTSTAILGWYECDDNDEAAELLISTAAVHARCRAYRNLVGPIDGSTWHRYRFGDPGNGVRFTLDTENPPWYPAQWERAGFRTVASYSSRLLDIVPEDFARVEIFERRFSDRGITIRGLDLARATDDLAAIHHLSMEAFQSNPFFTVISFAEFQTIYQPILGVVDPRLVLVAEDAAGRCVAFLFAIGNRTPGLEDIVVAKTVASLPHPAVRGIGTLLVEKAHLVAHSLGYRRAIHALMHDTNPSTRIASGRSRCIRRYRLFGREA